MDYSLIPSVADRQRHEDIDRVRALYGIAVEYDGVILDPTRVVLHTLEGGHGDDLDAIRLGVAQMREMLTRAVVQPPNAATFARCLYEVHEHVAGEFGYRFRPDTPVSWSELDDRNRMLLVAVAQEMLLAWPMERFAEPDPPGWNAPTRADAPGVDTGRW